MNSLHPGEHPVNVALRRAHRSILIVLGACALVIALNPSSAEVDATADPSRHHVYAATALGIVSIFTRRRHPATSASAARLHVRLSLASLVFAAGVGVVGVAAAMAGTPRSGALLFVLAGAIFALQSPQPVLPAPPSGGDVRPAGPK